MISNSYARARSQLRRGWARSKTLLAELIAPPACLACGATGRAPWCADCAAAAPAPIDVQVVDRLPLFACGLYEGPLAQAIQRFKYTPHPELAAPLAELLLSRLSNGSLTTVLENSLSQPRPLASPGDQIVWAPVPLHFARLVERGFNQAALLAHLLAHARRERSLPRLLERTRDTGHQAQLGQQQRATNVMGAFRVRQSPPPRVILVDDVVTTGATIAACHQALREQGSHVIAVVALAYAK